MEQNLTPDTGPNQTGDVLTVAEVARALRVNPMTVYRAIERGELKAHRVGRAVRITRAALTQWTGGSI